MDLYTTLQRETDTEGWDSNVEMSRYIRFQIVMLLFLPSVITALEGI